MATAADILGTVSRTKVPPRWASHYQRLCAERDQLLERDCSSVGGLQPKLDDLSDAASEETQRSLSLVAASATTGKVQDILDAIRRIEKGTYGICEITGQPISAERLNTIPWTRYSLEGQQQIEREGGGRRAGIPSLEGIPETNEEDAEAEDDSE